MSPTPAYDLLAAASLRLHHLGHLGAIVHWDQETNMPAKGNEARGAALAELAALMHRMRTEPQLRERIDRAEYEPLDALQRANLREIRREWQQANALPEALVQARSLASETYAGVVELVDAEDSKSSVRKDVSVRVRPPAPVKGVKRYRLKPLFYFSGIGLCPLPRIVSKIPTMLISPRQVVEKVSEGRLFKNARMQGVRCL